MLARLFLALPALAFAQAPAAEKCQLEGHIFSSTTGAPVKKATLRLYGSRPVTAVIGRASVAANGPTNTYVATSDAGGKFVFEDLDPGPYSLSAERVGYIRQNYRAKPGLPVGSLLYLNAGQNITDLVFKLTPQGLVYGKVLDEDGDAVPNAQVRLLKQTSVNGKKILQPQQFANSSPDGSFVTGGLAAGRYYLSVTAGSVGRPPTEKPGRKGAPEEAFVTTFYPNVTDPAAATPIEVGAGGEVRGIEVRLRKVPVFRVSGKVSAAAPSNNTTVVLIEKDSSNPVNPVARAIVRDGLFEFTDVPPGVYVLQPSGGAGATRDPVSGEIVQGPRPTGRATVTVSDSNVDNVTLMLGAGAEISGILKVEGVAAPAGVGISLVPIQNNGNGVYARTKPDGTFTLSGVAPDLFRVTMIDPPDGTYLKTMRFAHQDVVGGQIDLSSGTSGPLEILLSPHAADISGQVRNANGEPAPDAMVQVWVKGEAVARTVFSSSDGSFKVGRLAPGSYLAVAYDDIDADLAQDPMFRARFENRAAAATLQEDSHEKIEVKLIGKDAIDAELKKLP